ncbi:hypothetical protein [uncultured Mediterranean phage uvMED]|nr:hypothetical protein [uncultured Mediterranean phage uvMED]
MLIFLAWIIGIVVGAVMVDCAYYVAKEQAGYLIEDFRKGNE